MAHIAIKTINNIKTKYKPDINFISIINLRMLEPALQLFQSHCTFQRAMKHINSLSPQSKKYFVILRTKETVSLLTVNVAVGAIDYDVVCCMHLNN